MTPLSFSKEMPVYVELRRRRVEGAMLEKSRPGLAVGAGLLVTRALSRAEASSREIFETDCDGADDGKARTSQAKLRLLGEECASVLCCVVCVITSCGVDKWLCRQAIAQSKQVMYTGKQITARNRGQILQLYTAPGKTKGGSEIHWPSLSKVWLTFPEMPLMTQPRKSCPRVGCAV